MQKIILLLAVPFLVVLSSYSQDTFSIVAVDSITGEVGSAGASCVDLFTTPFSDDSFLGHLVPNLGAINTQAYYLQGNQINATSKLNEGYTPDEIIDWLVSNDLYLQPQYRQYGIAAIINGTPQTAAYTGSATDDYKNHIVGTNYSIQGNILLGQSVLDSMEQRFLDEPGDLACKLMAALQGANTIGADSRCASNGTSSLFAFVKVAQPKDTFSFPSFKVSVRTSDNSGIEPIDSLQTKFDLVHDCSSLGIAESEDFENHFTLYPNPASNYIRVKSKTQKTYQLQMSDLSGKLILEDTFLGDENIDVSQLESGTYLLKLVGEDGTFVKKIVIE